MSTELSTYIEELELFKSNELLKNTNFNDESLFAGQNSLSFNTKAEDAGNIYDVLPSLKGSKYDDELEIIKGELSLKTQNRSEIEVAQSLGIDVNPYDIVDGVLLSSNSNLLLMDSSGTLTLPETVEVIGEGAFADLEGLKTIIIPGTVKEISANAFRNNKDLENVIMEEGVTTIGVSAFMDCRNLKNVVFPDSLTSMGSQCFYLCTSLARVELPDNISHIASYSFSNCTNLSNVILPKNLTTIEVSAFSYCTSLTEISLPSLLTKIDASAFSLCYNLDNIDTSENINFIYEDNILMTSNKENILFIADKELKNIDTFSIPDGIKNWNYSLSSYSNIKKLNIPKSLESIPVTSIPLEIENIIVDENNTNFYVENECLYSYDKKKLILAFTKNDTVILNQNVENIQYYSFKSAPNVTSVTLPESVLSIGSQVFNRCNNLKTIYIDENVSFIEPLFVYTNYNVHLIIDSGNDYYSVETTENGDILYNKDKSTLITVLYKIQGTFNLANTVKVIGNQAFHNQNQMTSIILPEGLTEIGASFNYCDGLTKITIPSTVEKISTSAFNNANNLTKIQINKPKNSISGSPWGAIRGDRIVEWLAN